mgnify:CR=1 FL=1
MRVKLRGRWAELAEKKAALSAAITFLSDVKECLSRCNSTKDKLEQPSTVTYAKSFGSFRVNAKVEWNAGEFSLRCARTHSAPTVRLSETEFPLVDVTVDDAFDLFYTAKYRDRVKKLHAKQRRQKNRAKEVKDVHPVAATFSAAVFGAAFPSPSGVHRYSEEETRSASQVRGDGGNDGDDGNDDVDLSNVVRGSNEAKKIINLYRPLMRWPDELWFTHDGAVSALNRCTQAAAFLSLELKRRMLTWNDRQNVYVSEAVRRKQQRNKLRVTPAAATADRRSAGGAVLCACVVSHGEFLLQRSAITC